MRDEELGLENVLARNDADSKRLLEHSRKLFTTSTGHGSARKLRDWMLYCKLAHACTIPDLGLMEWPPAEDKWLQFLVHLRQSVSSFQMFKGVVGNVCHTAKMYWSKIDAGREERGELDPRLRYVFQHRKVMNDLRREYGMHVKQVAAITMEECRNACNFADWESVVGVSRLAAFYVLAGLGGRRPRSLTSIRLEDVELFAGEGRVSGAVVCVPHVKITFVDEKFDDLMGHRQASDQPFRERYEVMMYQSAAFWIYRLLVFRGVFHVNDPIKTCKAGERIWIKPGCLKFFLFCAVNQNFWIDTAPTSVAVIGNWNRDLLVAMGSDPRGASSHRSGFVTRACIKNIIESKGKKLSN